MLPFRKISGFKYSPVRIRWKFEAKASMLPQPSIYKRACGIEAMSMGVLVVPTLHASTAIQRCNVNSKGTDPMQSKLLVASKVFTVHLHRDFLTSPPTFFLTYLYSSSIRLISKALHRPTPMHLLLFRAPVPFTCSSLEN